MFNYLFRKNYTRTKLEEFDSCLYWFDSCLYWFDSCLYWFDSCLYWFWIQIYPQRRIFELRPQILTFQMYFNILCNICTKSLVKKAKGTNSKGTMKVNKRTEWILSLKYHPLRVTLYVKCFTLYSKKIINLRFLYWISTSNIN